MKYLFLILFIPFMLSDSTKVDSTKMIKKMNYKMKLQKESKEVKKNDARLDSLIKVYKKQIKR